MNKLWDDLKDNMKEWSASAVEKAEEISRVAVAKGEEFTKISRIKIEILQLQKEKSKDYEKLGGLVYHHARMIIWPILQGILNSLKSLSK